MFTHYANRSKDTAWRLTSDQFNTGDLYRQDANGNYFHLGREDDLIKVSGQWVYLREIETVGREFPHLIDISVESASENNRIYRKWGIKQRTNEAMAEDCVNRISDIIAGKFGLALPSPVEYA